MRFDLKKFARWLHSVLFYDHWMIGIIDQPVANAPSWTTLPPMRWLERPQKNRYLADPFPWPGSTDTLLAETFDLATRTGSIVRLRLNQNKIAEETPVDFGLPGHLSFPFMFQHGGEIYALPESAAARQLHILRWTGAAWLPYTTVLADTPAADATLFHHADLFWIAYTDISTHPHDNLHLLFAHNLTGPWTPHPSNPVQHGLHLSRNAGPVFVSNGKLYRPAQDCVPHYGAAIRLMEIIRCTPEAYEEREANRLTPNDPAYPDGLHTLTGWGNRTLIDGMHFRFSLAMVMTKIKRRLRLG